MTTILFVENNKQHCLIYEQELGLEGYDIVIANDWNKALEKILETPPDLIIVGLCTPELDRIYALVRFFHDYKNIPIILNTVYSKYDDHYLARIADGYIVKSSDLTKLKNKIKELLSKELKIPTLNTKV